MNYYNKLAFKTALMGGITAGVLLLASFMPWFTLSFGPFSYSTNGIDSNYHEGYASLVAGLLIFGAICFGRRILLGCISGAMTFIAFADIYEILSYSDRPEFVGVSATPSIGIFLVLAASVFGVVLSIALWEYAPKTELPPFEGWAEPTIFTDEQFPRMHEGYEIEQKYAESMKIHPSNS